MKKPWPGIAVLMILVWVGGKAVAQGPDGDHGDRGRNENRVREMAEPRARGERWEREGFGREAPGMGIRRPEGGGDMEVGLIDRLLDNERLVQDVGLTEDQIKRLRDGLHDLRAALDQWRGNMELAGLEQARILTGETVKEDDLMAAVEKTGKIRTEIAKLQMKQLLLIRQVLTKEQLAKVRGLRERRLEKFRQMRGDRERAEGGEQGRGVNPEAMKAWREKREAEGVDREAIRQRLREKMKARALRQGGAGDQDKNQEHGKEEEVF